MAVIFFTVLFILSSVAVAENKKLKDSTKIGWFGFEVVVIIIYIVILLLS